MALAMRIGSYEYLVKLPVLELLRMCEDLKELDKERGG